MKAILQFFINIFRTIWGAWHLLWCIITVLVFSPVYMIVFPIFGEKSAKFLIVMTYRFAAYMILLPTLQFVKNHGREQIDKSKSYMFVGNHSSNIDFYVHPHSCPVLARLIVKKELTKLPFFGIVMKAVAIPVDRSDKDSGKKGLAVLKEKMDLGYSGFIYAEGTRNKTDQPLAPFKAGAFRTAIDMQVPLVVTTIGNARQINNLRRSLFDACPGIVHVYWSEAISTEGMTRDDVSALMEKARGIMLGNLAKHGNV